MAIHSIVIPVFNEEEGLDALFNRVSKVIDGIDESCEVVLVNDGSRDRTGEIIDGFHRKDSRFKAVHFSRNFGHQVAITAGMEHTNGSTVSIIDGDLQDPPELIPEFIAKWKEGFEVVYGVRRSRKGEGYFKLLTAKIFYRVIRSLTHLDIPVDTGDFRLVDRKVADAFLRLRERHRYVRGLVSWVGFRQTGIYYDRAQRGAGETHYPLKKMIKLAFDAVASFSFFPLRLATAIGFFASVMAFLVGIWALYAKYGAKQAIPGWTSLVLISLFLGGTQLFCLGMVGEYVARTFDEVRNRPLYLVTRLTGFGKTTESRPKKSRKAA